jgi:hypothetical protein
MEATGEDKTQLLNVAVQAVDGRKDLRECQSSSSVLVSPNGYSCCRPQPATPHLVVIYTLLALYGLALVAFFFLTHVDVKAGVHTPIQHHRHQQQQLFGADDIVVGGGASYSGHDEVQPHSSLHGSLKFRHSSPNVDDIFENIDDDDDRDKMGRLMPDGNGDLVATGSSVGRNRTKRLVNAQAGELIRPAGGDEKPTAGSTIDVIGGDDEQTTVGGSTTNWSVTVNGDGKDERDDGDDGGYSFEGARDENLDSSLSEDNRTPDESRSRPRRQPTGSGKKKSSSPAPTGSGAAKGRKASRRQKFTHTSAGK